MSFVEVDLLRKQFDPPKGTLAVDDLSFSIEQGEIYSLLGPNGAGKTTTISILSGLLRPTAGDARVGGHSILKESASVKAMLGVVPQDIALYPDLSARENLDFWGKMYGLRGPELSRRVDSVLELIDLTDRQKERIEDYSGGMRRRVNIGAALLHEPSLLILDEPTVGIDPQSRRAILDGVRGFNRRGMTILYTTHYMEEAQELSHRIGIMDHGRMLADGTNEELVKIVGEQARVRLTVDCEDDRALKALCAVDGVTSSSLDATDGSTHLLVNDATAVVPRLFEVAARSGFRINEINVSEPNLETVFLHLTGRALRD